MSELDTLQPDESVPVVNPTCVPSELAFALLRQCAHERFDPPVLVPLLTSHGGILTRWLTWLNLGLAPDRLEEALHELGTSRCRHLVLLTLEELGCCDPDEDHDTSEQWLEDVGHAELAALGAAALGLDTEQARWLALLAWTPRGTISNPLLDEVRRFRCASDVELADTHPMLRVVVSALRHNEAERQASHTALLGLPMPTTGLSALAATRLNDATLARTRVNDLTAATARADAISQILAALRVVDGWSWRATQGPDHLLREAQSLLQLLGLSRTGAWLVEATGHTSDAAAQSRATGLGPLAAFELPLGSGPSKIGAAALRAHVSVVADADGAAIVDCQILNRLGADAAFVVPIGPAGAPLAVLLIAEEPTSSKYQALLLGWLRALLSEEFGAQLALRGRLSESVAQVRDLRDARVRELVHETNTPLATVQNHLHLLGLNSDLGEEAHASLALINGEVQRTATLIRDLLDRPERTELPVPATAAGVAMAPIISSVVDLLRPMATDSRIELRLEVDSSQLIASAHENAVRQIVTNLLTNAIEASAAVIPPDRPNLPVHVRVVDGVFQAGRAHISIEVEDEAGGIAPSLLAAMATPKASTKGGGHQGLGLAIVHRLAAEIAATLEARTSGSGTRFGLLVQIA